MNNNAVILLTMAACCFGIAYLFRPSNKRLPPTKCKLNEEKPYKYVSTHPSNVYEILRNRDKTNVSNS